MKQVFMSIFVVLLAILFSRVNTIHYPDLIFKRYVTVKNKKLADLLIGNINPDLKDEMKVTNKDELLVPGIVFYVLTLIFSVALFICLLTDNEYKEFFLYIVLSVAFFAGAFNSLNTIRNKIKMAKKRKNAIFTCVLYISVFGLNGILLVFSAFLSLE